MYKRSKIEMKKNIYFLILMLLIILLDQFSKMKILSYMLTYSEELILLPFLNFTLVFNSGVAFGIFRDFGQIVPQIFSFIGVMKTFEEDLLNYFPETEYIYELLNTQLEYLAESVKNIIVITNDLIDSY